MKGKFIRFHVKMQQWLCLKVCLKYFFEGGKKKKSYERPPVHSGRIFVIKYHYLETEMHGGAGHTVNQEARSPTRPVPLPDVALAAAPVQE